MLELFFYENIPFQINKISLMYACIFQNCCIFAVRYI